MYIKKYLYKFINLILIVSLALSLTACGSAQKGASAEPALKEVKAYTEGMYKYEKSKYTTSGNELMIGGSIYTVDDLSSVYAIRAAGKGQDNIFEYEIPGNSEIGYFNAETEDWVYEKLSEQSCDESVMTVEYDNGLLIVSCPKSYKKCGYDTVEYLPNEEGKINFEQRDGKWFITLSASIADADFCDCFALVSDEIELLRDRDNGAKVLERELRNRNFLWNCDGYYGKTPETYTPHGDDMYYGCVASYTLASMLSRVKVCKECVLFSFAFMDIESAKQNEFGFFPTDSRSDWLYEDYGIGASFYDTRFNTDLVGLYLQAIELFGADYFPEVLDSYLDFYIDFAKEYHFESKNGGWLVPDYWCKEMAAVPHSSLNHQAAELLLLYNASDILGREDCKELADSMLSAIEDCSRGFIMNNKNLNYAVFPDGHYGLQDYPYLTYNDLWNIQDYLYASTGQTSKELQRMMNSKERWMKKNGVTEYKQGGEWKK